MVLIDLVNIAAGAYKGYLNASGVEVDPSFLPLVVGSSTAVTTLYGFVAHPRHKRLVQGYGQESIDKVLDNPVTTFALDNVRQYNAQDEPNTTKASLKRGTGRAIMSTIEVGVGYSLGYFAQKILN
ncbi:MAG: hypothetical protein KC535_00605 [Nanoarchaeota archaeon]|nr:hypothetical protein [Nanoarchaeota archaeon]